MASEQILRRHGFIGHSGTLGMWESPGTLREPPRGAKEAQAEALGRPGSFKNGS